MWGDSLSKIVAALFPAESNFEHRKLLKLWLEFLEERERKTPSRIMPGTNSTLRTLKKMRLLIAIATNRAAESLYEALLTSRLNLRYIDYIIAHNPSKLFAQFLARRNSYPIIEGTPYKKPDRKYIAKLNRFLEKNGIMPYETIFCGDTLFDAKTALSAGYNFIPVLTSSIGTTNAWWEAHLAELKIPLLAIASSIRDLPLLIDTLEKKS